jgi:hypothetical protein
VEADGTQPVSCGERIACSCRVRLGELKRKLGKLSQAARAAGRYALVAKTNARAKDLVLTIQTLQAGGCGIARALNEQGIPTARGGGNWSAVQVARMLKRLQAN